MPKYLIAASYTAEGLRGLQKDKASGRLRAVTAAVEGLGGKVEAFYSALGEHDAYVIVDLPDMMTATALSIAVIGSRTRPHPDHRAADRRGDRPGARKERQLPRSRPLTAGASRSERGARL
jgi:uncharacterized protein with GYD domain